MATRIHAGRIFNVSFGSSARTSWSVRRSIPVRLRVVTGAFAICLCHHGCRKPWLLEGRYVSQRCTFFSVWRVSSKLGNRFRIHLHSGRCWLVRMRWVKVKTFFSPVGSDDVLNIFSRLEWSNETRKCPTLPMKIVHG